VLLNPAIFIVFLTACSSGESTQSTSQVIARVNGDDITVSQVSAESQKIKTKVSDSEQLLKKMLTGLIDRQLLVQEALKLNLDRSQEVQEAVASAKAQIYAQAYIAKKLAKLTKPNEQEIKQFIDEHPQYFAERKVFNTIDIVFDDQLDLNRLESEVTTIEALRNLLDTKGIQYQTVNNRFSTDGLPPALMDKIRQLKVGDLLFAHDHHKVIVKSVSSIDPHSLSGVQAEQIATRMLAEKGQQDFIVKEVSRLKALATIELFENNASLVPNEASATDDQSK
jgi:peptidyl-prolyl cis-trans isomerase C